VPAATDAVIDRARLRSLIARERHAFVAANPRSRELHDRASRSLIFGVPMPWMAKWVGGFPLYMASARGNRITDVDGHEYIDLSLGDTGSMPGHSPQATMDAVIERGQRLGGITTMMPTADASWVGEELARRFSVPFWQFALTATDANRFVLRIARQIQRRPKVLVFNWCYHGSVDETVAVIGPDGITTAAKPGNVGPQVDPAVTTKVVEFNDIDAVRAALAPGDVACVLTEPALTNIGIVLPDDGFLQALEEVCRETGTLLVMDETHTISIGPGGGTGTWGLHPDFVTIGKSLGAGVPIGAYGVSLAVLERIDADEEGDYLDWGGVGGTLAGNALSMAAVRATLEHVMTVEAFGVMTERATRYAAGVQRVIDDRRLPWSITRLGCRAEYHFYPTPPRSGGQAQSLIDDELDDYMHLHTMNRGILMTPFHNMALMCPDTTDADVDRHTEVFAEAVGELLG
jgi:glutamate-1-semialdehyde 2,1-aminomutase